MDATKPYEFIGFWSRTDPPVKSTLCLTTPDLTQQPSVSYSTALCRLDPPAAPDAIGFGAMDVAKPYEFIGFGAMDVTKPHEFIGFGAMDVTKPYEFTGFGTMDVTKPYEFVGLGLCFSCLLPLRGGGTGPVHVCLSYRYCPQPDLPVLFDRLAALPAPLDTQY